MRVTSEDHLATGEVCAAVGHGDLLFGGMTSDNKILGGQRSCYNDGKHMANIWQTYGKWAMSAMPMLHHMPKVFDLLNAK